MERTHAYSWRKARHLQMMPRQCAASVMRMPISMARRRDVRLE